MPLLNPRLRAVEKRFGVSLLSYVNDPALQRRGIELWIKRDDLLHPIISGNKWRKLKYILDHALSSSAATLVSMGGAYSNHLHALAYAGRCLELKTTGLVRGERPATLNPTLRDVQAWGMELRFMPRSEYKTLRHYKRWDSLPGIAPDGYWLPEGGSAQLALQGVGEIIDEIDVAYDALCTPCGTGTTLAGLIAAAPQVAVLGFAALKGGAFLHQDVAALLAGSAERRCSWSINLDYHCGGFAKTNAALRTFIQAFAGNTGITLEPVYTGKMLYGIYDLAQQGYFPPGTRIVALHTGGLQGNRGLGHA